MATFDPLSKPTSNSRKARMLLNPSERELRLASLFKRRSWAAVVSYFIGAVGSLIPRYQAAMALTRINEKIVNMK
eukprot:CAMPEP_0171857616 /NCGR_PEP_ID=MMETSP0992-20121227/24801_1 /TAXON_ID=483369 /ORGANISM="non described non described, Strain CCMP2098" /LENGTH=74 /DNA_ID=CAMNT_0012478897 /DNA_START=538 /DNA_END=762 /DNA_ORIENTATION=-